MQNNTINFKNVFQLKRATLESRIGKFYDDTHDAKATIKYLVALQIRDELSTEDFSFVLSELVRHIFLKTKATRALRRYYYLFLDYFTAKEWKHLTSRLFTVKRFVTEKLTQLMDLIEEVRPEAFAVP
ncbi:hypothetical protein JZO70_16110 [Enterococcus sp. 669A]|uniref:Uncharacterized protein n=1 Tax=Candidatus Enterococcus moelleringii TaxID=2815325 RepID=A0ABS3LDJ8_9ENTE|nr:hypothetical protein [Enterococcus sp. 669A]MBO1307702.1 hypothetical protein [Enterococcus sp. 669A]